MLFIRKQKCLFVIEYGLGFFKCHLVLGKIDFSLIIVPLEYHIYNIYT